MKHVESVLERMPSSRRAVRVAVAALIVVILGLIVVLFWQVHQNADALAQSAAVNRARGQALGTANAKLTQNGIAPVTPTPAKPTPGNTNLGPTTPSSTPSAEQGRKGDQGEPGPGPTTAQISAAVTDYCDAHSGCTSGPTKAQVAAAVLTYCKDDNCVGPTGAPGNDATGVPGSPGASGAVGRPPTADEISDAVAAYCADGACRGSTGPAGPAGPAGSDGKSGADAPRFTKIECTTSNDWLFTLSDGTTLTASGPCRATTVTTTVTAPPSSSPAPTSTAP